MAVVIYVLSLLAITNADSTWSHYRTSQNRGNKYGGFVPTTQVPYKSRNSGYNLRIGNGVNRQNNVIISKHSGLEPDYVLAESGPRNPVNPQRNFDENPQTNYECLTRHGEIVRYGRKPCRELNQNTERYGNRKPPRGYNPVSRDDGIYVTTRTDGTKVIDIGNGSSNRNTVVINDDGPFTDPQTRRRTYNRHYGTSTYFAPPVSPSARFSPRFNPEINYDEAISEILIGRGNDNKNYIYSA